ncbi:hypothetical protein [Methylacidimicrobium sp. B4]|uniref:hypothetical protein n=1 Tax=Methylacidimicrobium sp. B4 TaxID=2796139 RepID=UPI001A8FBF24|nr:hypothetical protein [Methylacidimicrobium sp. B4]QSR84099.1 hypothetical protein MacB4_07525 [Methylacidimicrobium sp. B4]
MAPSFRFALECLKLAFARVREAAGPSLTVGAAYFAFTFGLQWIASLRFLPGRFSVILAVLLCQGLLGILIVGLARFFLSLSEGNDPDFRELLDGFRAPWKILAGTLFGWLVGTFILLVLLVLGRAPLALLLVLGLLPLVLFGPFLIADGAVTQAADAFVASFRLGVSHYAQALAVGILVVGLVEIGALLIVGTLVSIPLCYTMTAIAYRSLVSQRQ